MDKESHRATSIPACLEEKILRHSIANAEDAEDENRVTSVNPISIPDLCIANDNKSLICDL